MTDKDKPKISAAKLMPDETVVNFVIEPKRNLGTWSLAYEVCGWNGEVFRTDVIPVEAASEQDAQVAAKKLWALCRRPHGSLERSRENPRVRYEAPIE